MRWGGSLNNFSVVPTGAAPICASSLANAVTTPALHLELRSFGFSPSPWGEQLELLLCFWWKLNNEAFPCLTRVELYFQPFPSYVKYPDVQWSWWLRVQSFPPSRPGKGSFVFPVHPKKESRASSIALGYGLKSKAMFICILLGLVRGTNMTFIFLKRSVNCHVRPKSWNIGN